MGVNNTLYAVTARAIATDSIKFKAVTNALVATGDAFDITKAGSGGKLTRMTMLGGSTTNAAVTVISTAGAFTIASQAFVKDSKVKLYCFDKTKAKCADKLGDFKEGTTYYIQSASATAASVSLKETKAGTTAKTTTTAIATHTEKIYMLLEHESYTTVAAATGTSAGSAARSLAMLGSAIGIFAAMLLA